MKQIPSVVVAVLLCSGHGFAQSLADVARKTEKQRADKAQPKAAAVYSNKDLKEPLTGGVGTSVLPSTIGEPTSSSIAATSSSVKGVEKRDETYWHDRMRSLHAKVDDDQTLLEAATTRERELDKRLHRSLDDIQYIPDRVTRAIIDSDWQRAVAEVSRLKAAVVNDQRAVKTAEEEARRADVPPSWLVRVQ